MVGFRILSKNLFVLIVFLPNNGLNFANLCNFVLSNFVEINFFSVPSI